MNNYQRIINMTIEEMAESRIYCEMNELYGKLMYKGDYTDFYFNKSEAIQKEIEWLNEEVE